MTHSLLPKPGYRPYFVQRGTVKDLDDQALDARPSPTKAPRRQGES